MKIKLAFLSNHWAIFSQIFLCKLIHCRYKEMKINQHIAGHMAKMAAMPIYGKKYFKNLLSRNCWANFDETLYEASETEALY